MPAGNPWTDIFKLFGVEDAIRKGAPPAFPKAMQ